MRKFIPVLAVLLTAQVSFAQNVYRVTVRDEATKAPVAGAAVTVKGTEITATTDARGVATLAGVPDGEQTLEVFSVGYGTTESKVTFPPAAPGETAVFIKVTRPSVSFLDSHLDGSI